MSVRRAAILILGLLGILLAAHRSQSADEPLFVDKGLVLSPVLEPLPPVGPLPQSPPAFSLPPASTDTEILPEKIVVEPEPPKPVPDSERLWERSIELGLDGSDGNSQTFNIRAGLDAKRKTKRHILAVDINYYQATNNSVETANQAFLNWRYERLLAESRWTWFVKGTVEYDEFKPFDLRVTLNTGAGYYSFQREGSYLLGRFGSGFSREIDGPDRTFVPELVFGLEGEHELSKRQKMKATAQYFPDVTEFGEYRIDFKASWQVMLDADKNLSLKFNVHDRYDSTAYGARPNDIDYSIVLLWEF